MIPPMRTVRPPRRPPALLLVALALLACGPEAPTGPLAVLERDLAWERAPAAAGAPAPEPLTLAWPLGEGAAGWTSPDAPIPAASGGVLRLGLGSWRLDSPEGAPLDPEVHHWLVLSGELPADSPGVDWTVAWRAEGEAFVPARTTSPLRLTGGDGPQTWSLPLDQLRGAREAGDASEGIVQLRLGFRAAAGADEPLPTAVLRLRSVVLTSDFDAAGDGPLPTHRLGRDGIHERGVALRAPGRASTSLAPGPGERLRLSLAVAGADAPVELRVSADDDALPEQRVRLEPGAPWRELVVDLAPLAGERTRLHLDAPAAGPRATVLVGGALRLGPDGRTAPDGGPLPDVVLYVEDTLRADALSIYGADFVVDEHLAAVAAEGVVVERVFAASNWTRPSVASLHTGLDPLSHGNTTHLRRLSAATETLAERLAAAGYQTAAFVTNYHAGGWSGLDQGFDHFEEPTAHGASRVESTLTSAVVQQPVADWLAAREGERVFVWVHSLDPHAPYAPPMDDLYPLMREAGVIPDETAETSLRYAAEVAHNDQRLAELDAALAASGRADRTLLVFASDHGEAFGEHDAHEHRKTLHQEEVAVPWVLRWPGVLPAGHRVEAAAGHEDMAPSLLGLLGLPRPEAWGGRDLSPALRATGAAPDAERPLLVHTVHEDGTTESVAAVRMPWKLVARLDADGAPQVEALYDLTEDPAEVRDRRDDPAAAGPREALLEWLRLTLPERRAAGRGAAAEGMSPEMRAWMEQMGYL